LLLQLRQ